MSTLSQRSFSGGEFSPSLYARTDFSKYQNALRTARNGIIEKYGGFANRSGSQFVGEVRTSGSPVRLIEFIFNAEQTFVLEFGDQRVRFIREAQYLYETSKAITNVVKGTVTDLTVAGHGYANFDEIYISGILGTTQLNNRSFKVVVVNANTIRLKEMGSGQDINSTAYGNYISGGSVKRLYELAVPYLTKDLQDLQYVQSADVLTIVNNNYAPAELRRISDTNWEYSVINFKSDVNFPVGIGTSDDTGTAKYREYKVTTIRQDDYKESQTGTGTNVQTIASITKANPARVTLTASVITLNDGDEYYFLVNGMTQLNDRRFFITNISGLSFDLSGVDSTDFGTFTSGTVRPCFFRIRKDPLDSASPQLVSWGYSDSDAQEFNVYRRDDQAGNFGLIGVAKGKSFKDIGLTPDTNFTPPIERNPFINDNDYPNAINYFQQRLVLANTVNDPEKIFTSKTGDFKNFGTSSPIQADDAITFKIAGRQVNEVKHLLDLGRLVVFTSGGEWLVNGNESSVLTPNDINTKQQTYNGASFLRPLIVNGTALYVQARGSIVRDIAYSFEADGYSGNDLTIFSFHLFEGFTLVDWAYQQIPHSIVWAVRSDGVLLGLTYLKEQQILAWHKHDFEGGFVENVCVVPEGSEDRLYVVVRRTINGRETRYVERLDTRKIVDIVDSKFLDSHLSYDGRNTTSTTVAINGGTTWAYDEDLSLNSSSAIFTSADVGNSIFLNLNGEQIRCKIKAFVNPTQVTVRSNKTVPVEFRSTNFTDWSRAVDMLGGLWHLEGKNVSIVGDGFVVANPNNPAYEVKTVLNGEVNLDRPYAVIHVGLPYTTDLETLDIDTPSGESISDKKMIVQKATFFVEDTRGVFVGPNSPNEANGFLDGLTEVKVRNSENYDSPVELQTGKIEVTIDSQWNSNGRVFVRQTDPMPMKILSVNPAGRFPFGGG